MSLSLSCNRRVPHPVAIVLGPLLAACSLPAGGLSGTVSRCPVVPAHPGVVLADALVSSRPRTSATGTILSSRASGSPVTDGKTPPSPTPSTSAETNGQHQTDFVAVRRAASASAARSDGPRVSAGTSAAKPTHAATQKTQQNASWVSARLQRVQDGDSLLVTLGDGQTEKLRIAGIDAPERTQPFSGRSRKHLLSLLEARPLRYRALKRDQYGRQIVILHSQQGKQRIDVNRAMLEAGMAWYFRRYERELPAELRSPYARAETEARRHRRGLWSESSPQPPWEFRRQKRRRNTTTSTGTKP